MLYVYDLVLVLVCIIFAIIIFLKSNKIFDFKSGDSTFYKAIEKRGDVSRMQLICLLNKENKYCHKKQKGTRLK